MARVLGCLLAGQGLSWSRALGRSLRQAGGDLLNDRRLSYQDLLAGHREATARRCQGLPVVLISQDTTALNYSGLRQVKGLGDLGNGQRGKGLWAHSALALSPDGTPLGVLQLSLWRRAKPRGKRQQRRQRPYSQKESARWERCAHEATWWAQPGQRVVVVSDRESDVFQYLMMPRREGVELLVRATQPRRCSDLAGQTLGRLPEVLAARPAAARFEVKVDGQWRGLELRWRRVLVQTPTAWRQAEQGTVPLTLLEVREPQPPAGCAALRWVLWTTIAVADTAAALDVARYYQRRWRIETMHEQLKTKGYQVERFQMRTVKALEKAIALNWVVVWRAMHLAYAARETPDEPAAEYFEAEELEVLSAVAGQPLETVQAAVWEVARLGGWEGYPSSPPPGPQTVEAGLRALAILRLGYAMGRAECDNDPR